MPESKRPKARELPLTRGYTPCEAEVNFETMKFRWRMERTRGEKFSPQCRNAAKYEVNGKILCGKHAGIYALKLLLPLPDVCDDCGRNTKAPLFDGCMVPNCPRGYKPCL